MMFFCVTKTPPFSDDRVTLIVVPSCAASSDWSGVVAKLNAPLNQSVELLTLSVNCCPVVRS
jgi:hypothetical protein